VDRRRGHHRDHDHRGGGCLFGERVAARTGADLGVPRGEDQLLSASRWPDAVGNRARARLAVAGRVREDETVMSHTPGV
jgi:hypothetical protein